MNSAALEKLTAQELEALYLHNDAFAIPTEGTYRGRYLLRIDSEASRNWFYNFVVYACFQTRHFGLNFFRDHANWYFHHKSLAAGYCAPTTQRSRWRDCDVIALDYAKSRLPAPIRNLLYDELKPLSDTLLLGMGGANLKNRSKGDLFFFCIELVP